MVAANLGVLGTTLFQDHMPDDVSQGLMVKLPLSGTPIDTYLPEYYRVGKVQVIVRLASYDIGKTLADRLRKTMTISMRANYLTFYNSTRPHSSLDARTPDRAYWDQLAKQPEAA